jgi:hypothetical protein
MQSSLGVHAGRVQVLEHGEHRSKKQTHLFLVRVSLCLDVQDKDIEPRNKLALDRLLNGFREGQP